MNDLAKRNITSWEETNISDKYLFKTFVLQLKQDVTEALELIAKYEEVYGIIEESIVFQ